MGALLGNASKKLITRSKRKIKGSMKIPEKPQDPLSSL